MKAKDLIHSLMTGQCTFPDFQPYVEVELLPVAEAYKTALAPMMHQSEKFAMCEDFEDKDEWDDFYEEIYHSALSLRECGLLKLPYGKAYFESKFLPTVRMQDRTWRQTKRVKTNNSSPEALLNQLLEVVEMGHYPVYSDKRLGAHVCCLAYETNASPDCIHVIPFFKWDHMSKYEYHSYITDIEIRKNPNEPLITFQNTVFEAIIPNEKLIGLCPNVSAIETCRQMHDLAARLVLSVLVMTHTKWARKRRVYPLEMQLRPRLIKRAKPYDGYTTVTIRPPKFDHNESTRSNGDTRHRMRLHLRRGHDRDQPYGVGKKLLKKIWIEPTLVGYREEGVITHDEYRIVTKKK